MPRLLHIVLVANLAVPCIAHADAGVPMLALAWPAQWLALIPIVLLECGISSRSLQMPFRQLIWPVGKANLVSTLAGIPLAWTAMLIPTFGIGIGLSFVAASTHIPDVVQYALFPLTAAWVAGESVWQIYFAFVVLAVPFCVVSIFIEERILRRMLPNLDHGVIHSSMVHANIWSYVLLSALALIFPLTT